METEVRGTSTLFDLAARNLEPEGRVGEADQRAQS